MSTINVGLAGLYQLEVGKLDADGNEIPESRRVVVPWFENLITNAGLDYLGSTSQDNLWTCRIGTGNAAPANTDTTLVAQVGSTTTVGRGETRGYDSNGKYLYRRVSRRFNPGTVSGYNLAEVGMSASGANLFSRSLIKDNNGNPTTIALASDEYLDVLYELRLYLPAQDQTVATTIDGVATTVTIRYSTHADALDSWAALLGTRIVPDLSLKEYTAYGRGVDVMPSAATVFMNSGSYNDNGTVTVAAYVPGSYTTTVTTVLTPGIANFTSGVGCLLMAGYSGNGNDIRFKSAYGWWAYGFSPALNKTNTRKATITVGVTWGRV